MARACHHLGFGRGASAISVPNRRKVRRGADHHKNLSTYSGLKLPASAGYEQNRPLFRRKTLKGIALSAVFLLILNDFASYHVPNPK